jgi:hypothetical protein
MTATDRLDFFLFGHSKQAHPQTFHLFNERVNRTYGLKEQILHLRVSFGLQSGADLGRSLAACAPTRADRSEQTIDFVAGPQAAVSR